MLRIISLFLLAALLATGLYQLACVLILHERSYAGRRVMRKLSRWERGTTDIWTSPLLTSITAAAERLVFFDAASRERLARRLERAEIQLSPETYVARMYVIGVFGVLGIVPCAVMQFWSGGIIVALSTVYAVLRQRESVTTKLKQRDTAIAAELPRFVRALYQQLLANRDIYGAIASYRRVVKGEDLGRELDILLAHIRVGSVSAALLQFQNRIGTAEAARLCGALIEIDRGIDHVATLNYIAEDMARQRKLDAQKTLALRPNKMRATFLPAVGVWVVMILYVLAAFALQQFKSII